MEKKISKSKYCKGVQQLMNAGCGCIAEASFMFDGLFCSVDILRKNQSGYDIIEVKSSTKTEYIHLDDVSYQYYVLFKSEIPINKVYVMYINNQYIRQGELDLQVLFASILIKIGRFRKIEGEYAYEIR